MTPSACGHAVPLRPNHVGNAGKDGQIPDRAETVAIEQSNAPAIKWKTLLLVGAHCTMSIVLEAAM